MELVFFALALCVSHALGQSLLQVLGTNLELSTLHYYVNRSVSLTTLLSTATNFTFLAPSNAAFVDYFPTQGQNFTNLSDDEVQAIISYHMLQGIWQSASWSPTQAHFPISYLKNATYTNVTAGQVVELTMDGEGGRDILSWNKSASSIVTPDITCTGGIIQIVSDFLIIPQSMETLTLKPNFKYFVAGMDVLGITTPESYDPVADAVNIPNVTIFVPNSAAALEAFTNITQSNPGNTTTLDILKYHIVDGYLGYSTTLQTGQLTTATGQNITITKQGETIFVNQAKIITPDYLTFCGVVHVIDNLLDANFNALPSSTPSPSATPTPLSTPSPTASPISAAASSSSSSAVKIGVGVTIGIVVPLIIAGFLVWYFKFRGSGVAQTRRIDTAEARPYQYVNNRGRQTKANEILGQDLELDPPPISNARYLKASAMELDSTPVLTIEPSEGTAEESQEMHELDEKANAGRRVSRQASTSRRS